MTGLKERAKTLPVWEGDYWRDRYDRTKGYANAEVSSLIDEFQEDDKKK